MTSQRACANEFSSSRRTLLSSIPAVGISSAANGFAQCSLADDCLIFEKVSEWHRYRDFLNNRNQDISDDEHERLMSMEKTLLNMQPKTTAGMAELLRYWLRNYGDDGDTSQTELAVIGNVIEAADRLSLN